MINWRTISILFVLFLTVIASYFYVLRRPRTAFESAPNNTSIIVGTNAQYPPFCFMEQDKIVGFDIDIITEIAQRLNKSINIKNMPFAALFPELQAGSIQVIAAGVTPTKERSEWASFTSVYFSSDPFMTVQLKDNPPITTAAGLKDKVVAVNKGYTADHYLAGLQGFKTMRLSSPSMSAGIMAVKNKQADVYVAPKSTITSYFSKNKEEQYQINPLEGTEETYALAVSKKDPELYNSIQQELTKMMQDGTIESLKKKWGLA